MKLAYWLFVAAATSTAACGTSTSESSTGGGGTGANGKGGASSGGSGGATGGSGGNTTGGTGAGATGGTGPGGSAGSGGIAAGGQAGAASGGTAGSTFASVGDACNKETTCASTEFGAGVCEASVPGGYCTIVIAECPAGSGAGACPAGSTCVNGIKFGDKFGDFCLKNCQNGNDCRTGYSCCPWQGGIQPTGVCLAGTSCP